MAGNEIFCASSSLPPQADLSDDSVPDELMISGNELKATFRNECGPFLFCLWGAYAVPGRCPWLDAESFVSLFCGGSVTGNLLFLQLSIPPCFTYSAAHGNSNSVRLVVRLRFVAVFLSVSLSRADGASRLLAGTGSEFAISNESCSHRTCQRPCRTNRVGVFGQGRAQRVDRGRSEF